MDNAEKFAKDKYCVIKKAIPEDLIFLITQYALFDELQDFCADGDQVPDAHAKYADPAMESMLMYLLPIMEKNTGLKLYPTYSFYRVYRNGDVLKPHIDRESCEISTTVSFYYSYDDSQYTWPIIMDGKSIIMSPGDIVIYRGIELEHSRDAFAPPGNDWHVQAFFHYVDAHGPHAEWKWDKRNAIGEKQSKFQNTEKNYLKVARW